MRGTDADIAELRKRAGVVSVTVGRKTVRTAMTLSSHVDVPVPPSTNNLYLNARKGRIKSPQYKAWIASAMWDIQKLKPATRKPFRLTYTLFGGSDLNLSRDLGNVEKPLTDLLVNNGKIPQDSLKAGLHEIVLRFVENDEGAAYVRIEIT